jgi:hypothetical protein
MRQRSCVRLLTAGLCILACAAVAVSWRTTGLGTVRRDVRTDDKNRDGRPDIWRVYDPQGRLSAMAVDTNFDGRSDVHEYYERGSLVRRESDRDFNDRVDLVQEFDAGTTEAIRSVSDVDFDGVADLLVLFHRGRPVYSQWRHAGAPAVPATPTTAAPRSYRGTADRQLVPLDDPFRTDRIVRTAGSGRSFNDAVSLPAGEGLCEPRHRTARPCPSPSGLADAHTSSLRSAPVVEHTPRGPPTAALFS